MNSESKTKRVTEGCTDCKSSDDVLSSANGCCLDALARVENSDTYNAVLCSSDDIVNGLTTIELTDEQTDELLTDAYALNKKLKELLRQQGDVNIFSSADQTKISRRKSRPVTSAECCPGFAAQASVPSAKRLAGHHVLPPIQQPKAKPKCTSAHSTAVINSPYSASVRQSSTRGKKSQSQP